MDQAMAEARVVAQIDTDNQQETCKYGVMNSEKTHEVLQAPQWYSYKPQQTSAVWTIAYCHAS